LTEAEMLHLIAKEIEMIEGSETGSERWDLATTGEKMQTLHQ
jgi:hypothetical protein